MTFNFFKNWRGAKAARKHERLALNEKWFLAACAKFGVDPEEHRGYFAEIDWENAGLLEDSFKWKLRRDLKLKREEQEVRDAMRAFSAEMTSRTADDELFESLRQRALTDSTAAVAFSTMYKARADAAANIRAARIKANAEPAHISVTHYNGGDDGGMLGFP